MNESEKVAYEKIDIGMDIDTDEMENQLKSIKEKYSPVGDYSVLTGYGLVSSNGKWDDGMDYGRNSCDYDKHTELHTGYMCQITRKLMALGLYPRRVRLSRLTPGAISEWHRDVSDDSYYFIRLHIPFITSPECMYGYRFEESKDEPKYIHMQKGEVYIIDASIEHKIINVSKEERWHYMADVYDTNGITEHFKISETVKNLFAWNQVKGKIEYERKLLSGRQ